MSPDARPAIESFALGPFETNAYLVHVPPDPTCWIIDAPFDPDPIIQRIGTLKLQPTRLILTHAHADHIAGLAQLLAAFPGLDVLIHQLEADFLTDPRRNLSADFGVPVIAPRASTMLLGGEALDLAGSTWHVLHTPGHSPGGITLHNPHAAVAFVGDTLFAGSIGRFDFPTSDPDALIRSIQSVLYALPDATRVFAGHGPPTTIGTEKRSNPFVRASGPQTPT